jgi:hypothetical protein
MSRKKAIETTTSKELAPFGIALGKDDINAGFEEADQSAYAIPFLTILQNNSPQCDDDDPDYVKEAKAGKIYNTVSGELYDSVKIIPVKYQRQFIEWIPRTEGGGLVAYHTADAAVELMSNATKNEKGVPILKNGHELKDHRNHFILVVSSKEQAIVSMTSSQIKKSRRWMSNMGALKVVINKQKVTPPMYASVYLLGTIKEENDKGKWYGWTIEFSRFVNNDEFEAAKEFKKMIDSIDLSSFMAGAANLQKTEADNY